MDKVEDLDMSNLLLKKLYKRLYSKLEKKLMVDQLKLMLLLNAKVVEAAAEVAIETSETIETEMVVEEDNVLVEEEAAEEVEAAEVEEAVVVISLPEKEILLSLEATKLNFRDEKKYHFLSSKITIIIYFVYYIIFNI